MQRLAHFLEHEPLVGGVLVDDDKPVLRLGNDVVFVDLCTCRTQRKLLRRSHVSGLTL
jgi:hypothetical protein